MDERPKMIVAAPFEKRVAKFLDTYWGLPDGADVAVLGGTRSKLSDLPGAPEDAALAFMMEGDLFPFSTDEAREIASRLDEGAETTEPGLEPETIEQMRQLASVLRAAADTAEMTPNTLN
jgi:hypothetical protein